ncbi:MAG TPA: sigma 54-interacting transcriptional regulator [Vicinamibacterales bacterium]|jgi:two-component system nitrogen regulation response regulator NtrX|nr:sigma 54-interacting transcriptional regulator [Vicinamibacterales bacterium]
MPATSASSPALAPARGWPPDLTGSSDAVRLARDRIGKAAAREGGALLVAERGYDLEAIAREAHVSASGPFATLDCAMPDVSEVERSLFGTATVPGRRGARAEALETVGESALLVTTSGGTLLLTSIAELPASAQARLARILRDREARVEGTEGSRRLSLRIVATTRPPVEAEVDEGRLRPELYRRLAAVRIDLPALARRREDIPAIARHIVHDVSDARGIAARSFTQAALALVAALPWDGNVDELRRVIEGVCATAPGPAIRVEDVLGQVLLDARQGALGPQASLREARRQFEREYIAAVLRHYEGRMGPAARVLGIQRTNLYRKARQLGIQPRKVAE